MLKFLIIKLSVIALLVIGYTTWKGYKEDEAQAYFDMRCKDAGEFIYRTVENVEGVFQMRERDPRDYFTRLREGDLPEDPYGHTNVEAQRPWNLFLRHPSEQTYHFFETVKTPSFSRLDTRKFSKKLKIGDEPYWSFTYDGLKKLKNINKDEFRTMLYPQQVSELKSKYGFTWREVQTNEDKKYGVIGGELIVKELVTEEVLGVRKGFFFWPPESKKAGICPKEKYDAITFVFVSKILKPKPFDESILVEKDYGH